MRDTCVGTKEMVITKVRGMVTTVGKEAVISEGHMKNFWGVGLAWAVIDGCVCFLMFSNYIFY